MEEGSPLRALLRRVPAPVAVVTVEVAGQRVGLTVDSLVSLSLDPPLVGVAVSRQAALHELLVEAGAFAVNVLSSTQEAVAAHFARGVPPIAMWAGVELRDRGGAPLLAGCVGWIECTLLERVDAGDHSLFVGEVDCVEEGVAGSALVHVEGRYRA